MLKLLLKAFKKKEQEPEPVDTGISREDWLRLKCYTLAEHGWLFLPGVGWAHPNSGPLSSIMNTDQAYHATILCMEEALKAE